MLERALKSIPQRKDIEIIFVNDCSTDNSLAIIDRWTEKYAAAFSDVQIVELLENRGCGYTRQVAYPLAEGKYLTVLDSDDYLYTKEYSQILDRLAAQDADMLFVGCRVNNGEEWIGNDRKAPWSYFLKREFLERSRLDYPDMRRAGDFWFTSVLRSRPHVEVVWPDIVYHYNYPCEGSIVWNYYTHEQNCKKYRIRREG